VRWFWLSASVLALVVMTQSGCNAGRATPRVDEARGVPVEFLKSSYDARTRLVTTPWGETRLGGAMHRTYPPVLSISARDIHETLQDGNQDVLAFQVRFLGPPFIEEFDVMKTRDGRWLVDSTGGG
jgi:hypothetical protein